MIANNHARFIAVTEFIALLFAASTAQQRTLTLEECLAIARDHNPSLRIAARNLRINELAISEQRSAALPSVKLGGGASYAPYGSTAGYDPAITNGGQLSAQLIVQQPLYDPGRKIRSEQIALERSRISLQQRATQRDLEAAVRQAYIDALAAQEETTLQQESLRQIEEYLNLVTAMKAAGNASPTDVLKTQAQLGSARLGLDKAMETEIIGRLALAQAMGTPGDTSIRAAGSVRDMPVTVPEGVPGKAGNDSGFTTIDPGIAELEAQKGDLDVALARKERLPTVSLSADAGLLTSVDNVRPGVDNRFPFVGASAGVSAEMPIFSWGAAGYREEQRRLAALSLRDSALALSQWISTQRQTMAAQVRSAFANQKTLNGIIKSLEDNFLLTRSKYAGGAALSQEVLLAQQQLAEVRLMALRNETDIRLLQIRLNQLTARE
jgi:outer membrane protein